MPPLARVGDMHTCPMVNPSGSPHVGGPIMPPGDATVLINGQPAAVGSGMCTCAGPPDSLIMGSTTVIIGGKPAIRMGDTTAHGGQVVVGSPNVIVG